MWTNGPDPSMLDGSDQIATSRLRGLKNKELCFSVRDIRVREMGRLRYFVISRLGVLEDKTFIPLVGDTRVRELNQQSKSI